jgi:hypothetical protein
MSLNEWREHMMRDKSFGWLQTPKGSAAHINALQAIANGFAGKPQLNPQGGSR